MEQKLMLYDGNFITYKYINNDSEKDFEILFLHGFNSNMDGNKVVLIEQIAKENNLNLLKLNYLGHGTSSGELIDFNLTDWISNVELIINKISNKKLLLIGSSLGAWIASIMAIRYKDKIKGIINIAPSIDFFTEVIENQIKQDDATKDIVFDMLNKDGKSTGKYITKKLLDDSRKYNLLQLQKIEIYCPVMILQSFKDEDVPYYISVKFAEKLATDEVELILVKNANHRFSLDGNSNFIEKNIKDFINKLSLK